MDPVADLLGLDPADAEQRLATDLVRNDRKWLADLIKLRQAKMSQTEMANALGVSQSAVSQFETGDRDPRLSTIRAYALALGAYIEHSIRDASTHDVVVDNFMATRNVYGADQIHFLHGRQSRADVHERILGLEIEYNGQSRRIELPQ